MVLAIAVEAVVKLFAFLAVGIFVTFVLFDGPRDLFAEAAAVPEIAEKFARDLPGGGWLAQTALAAVACLLLPRQFHIAVVENNSPGEIRRAAWLFPAYLIAINIFVVPIAVAGLLGLGGVGRCRPLRAGGSARGRRGSSSRSSPSSAGCRPPPPWSSSRAWRSPS